MFKVGAKLSLRNCNSALWQERSSTSSTVNFNVICWISTACEQ